MTDPPPISAASELLGSAAYRTASLRCERLRLEWTAIVIAIVGVFAFLRTFVTGVGADRYTRVAILGVLVFGLAIELGMMLIVRRSLAKGRLPLEWTWLANAMLEALLPTAIILVLTFSPDYGPFRSLVSPATMLYVVLILLATLRLRPLLCVASGLVAALGYGAICAWTFRAFPPPPPDVAALVTTYQTTGIILLVLAGLAGGLVSNQIRQHLLAALREAHARRAAEVRSRDTLLFGLAKLAEYRDSDTGTHLERIADYCEILATALDREGAPVDREWIQTLRTASSMHDIGKVGIADRVLCKPGKLTDEERAEMQLHPVLGAEALTAVREQGLRGDPLIEMSIEIAIGHHERWDGQGYPRGLAGPEIQLAARITAVADVYDALTVRRVYKDPMPHEKACAIIQEGRGTQFDPDVVDAFTRVQDRFDVVRARHAKGMTNGPPSEGRAG